MKKEPKELRKQHLLLAGFISGFLLRMQGHWVTAMDKSVNRLSPRMRKLVFSIWTGAMASLYLLLIFKPFSGNQDPPLTTVTPFVIPTLPAPPASADYLQQEANLAVKRFEQFRDSLKRKGGENWERFQRMYPSTETKKTEKNGK